MKANLILMRSLCLFVMYLALLGCDNRKREATPELGSDILSISINTLVEKGYIPTKGSNGGIELGIVDQMIRNNGIGGVSFISGSFFQKLDKKDSTWLEFLRELDMDRVLNGQSGEVKYVVLGEIRIPKCKLHSLSKDRFALEVQRDTFWSDYYSKNPQSIGIICVSEILYSTKGDKAMLTIQYYGGRLNAFEVRIFLEHVSNWKIYEVTELWVS